MADMPSILKRLQGIDSTIDQDLSRALKPFLLDPDSLKIAAAIQPRCSPRELQVWQHRLDTECQRLDHSTWQRLCRPAETTLIASKPKALRA
jgi:hypothetical protein